MLELKQFQRRVLKLSSADDVAVALTELKRGEEIVLDGHAVRLLTDVPAKHKLLSRILPLVRSSLCTER